MAHYTIIAAVADNGVIGAHGKIPWHISADFQHFKATTLAHVIVMGRGTWESIGSRPLPGRTTIVLTASKIPGIQTFLSIHELDRYLQEQYPTEEIFVCWGAQIYRAYLADGMVRKLLISRIPLSPEGDVFFPSFQWGRTLESTQQMDWFVLETWLS